MQCPACRTTTDPTARYCPKCGYHANVTATARKNASWMVVVWVAIGVIAVASVLYELPARARNASAAKTMRVAVYEVTGDREGMVATLTYENERGESEERTVTLPWRLPMKRVTGSFMYLSARKRDPAGAIHATISVEGRQLQNAAADSPYGIVSISSSVP